MDFSNSKWVNKLRIFFLISGLCWVFTIALLIFLEYFGASVILAGLFLVAISLIAIMNFQYVRITVEKEKMAVRYYSIFAVDRMFRMFEFPVAYLRNIEIRHYFIGLKLEIRFTVRVKKGLADYPWINLSAMSFRDRAKLIGALRNFTPDSRLN